MISESEIVVPGLGFQDPSISIVIAIVRIQIKDGICSFSGPDENRRREED